MKLKNNIFYTIKQGVKGTFKNKTMGFLSVVSVASVLIILGIVMSIVTNIDKFIKITEEQVNEVKVSIEQSLSDKEIDKIEEEISKIQDITNIEYLSKEEAFKNLHASWGEDAYLLEGLDNPLDDVFILKVTDSQVIPELEQQLLSIENVQEVEYHKEVMDNFIEISNTATKFGFVVILFLLVVCLVLISNTIRSKVYSKKEEIQIIKYVGGSNAFIIAPFIVEGLVIGLIGSTTSILTCMGIYQYVMNNIMNVNSQMLSTTLLSMQELGMYLVPVLAITGIGIGVLGSIISVKRYIKV